MKKLLIGLVALSSLSAFAGAKCDIYLNEELLDSIVAAGDGVSGVVGPISKSVSMEYRNNLESGHSYLIIRRQNEKGQFFISSENLSNINDPEQTVDLKEQDLRIICKRI